MRPDPVTVPASTSVRELVDDYFYRHYFKAFPVLDDGRLVGCVTSDHVKKLAREDWPRAAVRDIMEPCSAHNTIAPEADALEAVTKMRRTGGGRLMVLERGRLIGIVSMRDLLSFLAVKLDLEEAAGAGAQAETPGSGAEPARRRGVGRVR